MVAPSLTPTGIRTRSSRVRTSLPRPLQVGQGSSISVPRPWQVGQGLERPNSPWSRVTVPRPLQVGQGRGRVPGLAPEPWQVWQGAGARRLGLAAAAEQVAEQVAEAAQVLDPDPTSAGEPAPAAREAAEAAAPERARGQQPPGLV